MENSLCYLEDFLKWNFLAPMRFGINIPWVGVVLLVGGTLTIDFNGSS